MQIKNVNPMRENMMALIKYKLFPLFYCLIFFSEFQSLHSKEWSRAYLASYPRSGNHWIRYLVEEATNVATGSVYIDIEPQHMHKVFPWGGYCCDHGCLGHCRYPTKDDIVLIKTHFPSQVNKETKFDKRPYQVTLRVVRHPVDSFYSRYVRKPEGPLLDKVPRERVVSFIKSWRKFQNYWNKKNNVITFRYEDFLANPAVELKKFLEALEYDVTDEDIQRAVSKHPPLGHMLKSIDRFTENDLDIISEELGDLLTQFNYETPIR